MRYPLLNPNLLDLGFSPIDSHHGESDLLIEPALTAASRIQPEYTALRLLGIFMRVTVDDHIYVIKALGDKFLIMYDKEPAFLNLKGQAFRYIFRPLFIVVSPHDIDRSYLIEPVNDFWFIDISAVNDCVASGDLLEHLRAEQAVGIGENRYLR